jgi:ATP-binding cassette subfamily C (CFTR/MRP) protein 4
MACTLTGISTIRASNVQSQLTLEFDNLQNVHSSVWQTLMGINTGVCCKTINDIRGERRLRRKLIKKIFLSISLVWCFPLSFIVALGLWLDCVSCTFVASVCFSFIMMSQENSTNSSNAGLAISQSLILMGMVQYGIKQMMESFQLFTNTERVLEYTRLEQEPLISRKPTRDWPFKGISHSSLALSFIHSPQLIFFFSSFPSSSSIGLIEIKNMSLYYDVHSTPALKNINLTIEPGSKIGIVGR